MMRTWLKKLSSLSFLTRGIARAAQRHSIRHRIGLSSLFILSLFSLWDSYSQQPWAFDKYSPSLAEQRIDSIHSYLDPKYSYHTPTSDSGFTVLGEWRWGACIAAAAVGNYVYIGNGGLLQVLEVSQPAAPHVVWETKTGLVRDMVYGVDVSELKGLCTIVNIQENRWPR